MDMTWGGEMSGKRSRRSKVQKFYCPYCEERLWRRGGFKHYLLYADIGDINYYSKISSRQLEMVPDKNARIDHGRWIEKFFCHNHGKVWLLVSKSEFNHLTTRLAVSSDWQCLIGTSHEDEGCN
jgi:hypothetical protein